MTNQRWIIITASLVTAGGLAWLAKMGVIAATDGGDDQPATAFFYLTGVALMAAGACAPLFRAIRARGRAFTALRLLASPFVFVISYVVLEGVGKALVGEAGPSWLPEEIGILLTGAFWLALGVALLRESGAPARSQSEEALLRG